MIKIIVMICTNQKPNRIACLYNFKVLIIISLLNILSLFLLLPSEKNNRAKTDSTT